METNLNYPTSSRPIRIQQKLNKLIYRLVSLKDDMESAEKDFTRPINLLNSAIALVEAAGTHVERLRRRRTNNGE